jgi:hypothetical protein
LIDSERKKNLHNIKTKSSALAAIEFRDPINSVITSLNLLENSLDLNENSEAYFYAARNTSKLMLY